MMRYFLFTVGLTATYALALASADPWDLGVGAIISVFILSVFRRFILAGKALPASTMLQRAMRFPALALATMMLVVQGTIQVARAVLGQSSPERAGFVTLPRGNRTPTGVVVNGLIDTLSPGSVLVNVDPEEETWTLHALDAVDSDEFQAEIDRFYERYQRPVWP